MSRFAARIVILLITVAAGSVVAAPAGGAATLFHTGAIASIDANQSSNWGGYNQGAIEKGGIFTSVAGDWTVPTATQHTHGQDEYSSAWIGIGGGCPDPNCLTPSATLIQTGTEQDVDASGKASYSAWWELIPAPSITIDSLTIHPGDRMHASITEAATGSNVWTISISDVTTAQSWSQTVPYSSTHDSAEWIVETPLVFGTGGAGLSAMPNLGTVHFDLATANGHPAGLVASEEIQLVDANGNPVATPSAPDAQQDGFNVCVFSSSCGTPTSSLSVKHKKHRAS